MAVDKNGDCCESGPWHSMFDDLVRIQQEITYNIEIVEYERRQFERFIDTLTTDERNQLGALFIRSQALSVGLKERTLAKIGQVVEAVAWRFGLEQDIHLESVRNADESVANRLSLFEVM